MELNVVGVHLKGFESKPETDLNSKWNSKAISDRQRQREQYRFPI